MSRHNAPEVIIIGAGITGLSLAATLEQCGVPFVILERSDRVGGQIRTLEQDGFVFETGPNTGVISAPEVMELFDYAAPYATLQVARKEAAARWIWKGDRFHVLPSGPVGGLFTPLFTWRDKLRLLGEPFRRKGSDPLESVGTLAERRLGKSFVDYAIDPFIGGIYAGDPYRLNTRYALPKLYDLEQEYGSFIRGAIQKAKQPKSERERRATKEVFSAVGGLEMLVRAVAKKVSRMGEIVTDVSEISIEQGDGAQWVVTYRRQGDGDRKLLSTKHVVTTVRAEQLESLLPSALRPSLPPIASLVYAPVVEISVGYRHLPGVRRDAFGGLVPSCERRKILGILFPSSCFDDRTPYEDSALFTIFVGGLRQGEVLKSLRDEQLVALGLGELTQMMRIPKGIEPDMIALSKHERAIPQYDETSELRVRRIKEIEQMYPGLHLAGGIIDGIGLAHRITQGAHLGKGIVDQLTK